MLYLTEADILETIGIADVFTFVEKGIWGHANGRVVGSSFRLPLSERRFIYTSGGYLIGEPWAFVQSTALGWLPVATNAAQTPLVTLIEVATGEPACVFEADWALAVKNSVANAVAAAGLARSDATTAAVIGAGRAAHSHVRALAERFNLKKVWLLAADPGQAQADAAQLQGHQDVLVVPWPLSDMTTALAEADVVLCLGAVNGARVEPDQLKPGVLVLRTGKGPSLSEAVLTGADLLVADDWGNAEQQIDEVRALKAAGRWQAPDTTWPAIVANRRPGRQSNDDRIVYLATGIQSASAALFPEIFRRAQLLGLGRVIQS